MSGTDNQFREELARAKKKAEKKVDDDCDDGKDDDDVEASQNTAD